MSYQYLLPSTPTVTIKIVGYVDPLVAIDSTETVTYSAPAITKAVREFSKRMARQGVRFDRPLVVTRVN